MTQYVFMNRYSQNQNEAVDFLRLLYDILNEDVETDMQIYSYSYCKLEDGMQYIPQWLYYSIEYITPLNDATSLAVETDGSDGAIRQLAQDAANGLKMRLEG